MNNEKVVLITGAANGLGWGLSKAFHNLGYSLFLVDWDQSALIVRLNHLHNQPKQRVETLAIDLLEDDASTTVFEHFGSCFSQLNVLINNAGITHRSLAAETELAVTQKIMQLDYIVPVALTLKFAPLLKRTGSQNDPSRIINLGSMAGWMPVLGRSGYCAAKSALHQYFETFRAENTHRPIEILMVYPSFLATDIEKNALNGQGSKAAHARSTTGAIHSVDWMVERILTAYHKRQSRLFPNKSIALASLIYRLMPTLFLTMMKRKFSSELSSASPATNAR